MANKPMTVRSFPTLDDTLASSKVVGTMYVSSVNPTKSGNHQRVTLVLEGSTLPERFVILLPKDAAAPKPGTRIENPSFACLTARDESGDIVRMEPEWVEAKVREDGTTTPRMLYYRLALLGVDSVTPPASSALEIAAGIFAAKAE